SQPAQLPISTWMFGIERGEGAASASAGEPTSATASFDSSAAMVRSEADHLDATLHALVTRLSSVPGLHLSVSYRHGRLRRFLGDLPYINDLNRRTGPVQRIAVAVGSQSYWLHRDLGWIQCG